MGSNYIITSTGSFVAEDELYHHGIKGQKWGIRRYQNPDGSLTAAGRKKYTNPDGTLNKKGRKKFGDSANINTLKTKTVKDMTDEELDKAIIRARKEDEYNRLRPQESTETGGRSSRKVMSKLIDDAVIPAVVASGRNALQKALDNLAKKYLGEKLDPNSYEALKKQYDILKVKKDIEDLKKGKERELTWDEKLKKQTYEKNERERAKEEAREAGKNEKSDSNKPKPSNMETTEKRVDDYLDKITIKDYRNNKSSYTPDKDYEKRVDDLLAEIDQKGWERYYREYGGS